jgi:hypothetical protein
MYAALIKNIMAVNEACDESLKHFFKNWGNGFAVPLNIVFSPFFNWLWYYLVLLLLEFSLIWIFIQISHL